MFLIALLFAASPLATQSMSDYEFRKVNLQEKIAYYAEKYEQPVELMNYIVDRESSYDRTAVGDEHLTCTKTGKPMRSRGLVQINDCYHEISDDQALDVDFSLNFLGKHLQKGFCRWWTTCRDYEKRNS